MLELFVVGMTENEKMQHCIQFACVGGDLPPPFSREICCDLPIEVVNRLQFSELARMEGAVRAIDVWYDMKNGLENAANSVLIG